MQKERISNETLSILATVHYLRKQLYAILNSQSHVKLLFSESSSYLLGSPVRRSFFVQKRGNQHTIKHDGSQLRIMHRKNDFIEHKLSDPETNCSKVQHCIPLHYTQQQYTVHNTSRILMLLSFGSYVVLYQQYSTRWKSMYYTVSTQHLQILGQQFSSLYCMMWFRVQKSDTSKC